MRFVILCFVFLALGFYQMSGGANFVPRSTERQAMADAAATEDPKPAVTPAPAPRKAPVTAVARTREEPVILEETPRPAADASAVVPAVPA